MYQIKGDMHTHTLYSRHAYSTIQENVTAAAEQGLEMLGSADHFGDMLFTERDIRTFQFFLNVGIWPRRWKGVALFRACEADILTLRGDLYGQELRLDFCAYLRPEKKFPSARELHDQIAENIREAASLVSLTERDGKTDK